MAASANAQLSLQIHRSLQAQVQSVDSTMAQQTSPSPTTSDFSEVSVSLAPSVETFGPPAPSFLPPPDIQSHFSGVSAPYSSRSPSQIVIAHPYARLYAKKNATGTKRRKIWNHALEKSVFSAHEMYVGIVNPYVIPGADSRRQSNNGCAPSSDNLYSYPRGAHRPSPFATTGNWFVSGAI